MTRACREWNQAYAQLEMERGFCSLGGAEKYSPELVQRRALESPAAAARVALRGGEMLWRLGLFACSLLADNLAGLSEEGDRVRLRARQLRCGPDLLCVSRVFSDRSSALLAVAPGPHACGLLACEFHRHIHVCVCRTGRCAWTLAGPGLCAQYMPADRVLLVNSLVLGVATGRR